SPAGTKSTKRDFFFENGVLKKVIESSASGVTSRIELVTTASQMPDESAKSYIDAFKLLGAANVKHLPIRTRADAKDPQYIKRLQEADVVLFTGGDQLRLTSTIGGTLFHQTLLQKYYHEDFLYVGTSAGA